MTPGTSYAIRGLLPRLKSVIRRRRLADGQVDEFVALPESPRHVELHTWFPIAATTRWDLNGLKVTSPTWLGRLASLTQVLCIVLKGFRRSIRDHRIYIVTI